METHDNPYHAQEYPLGAAAKMSPTRGRRPTFSRWSAQSGIALVMAMLMSMAIMALAAGVLYFVNQSTRIAGAGKRYASASEAADGAIQLVKETINLTMRTDLDALNALTLQTYSNADTACIETAIWSNASPCENAALILLGAMGGQNYIANISLQRLYTATVPGISVIFPPSGISSTATFYRITATVTGPSSAAAEVSVLYRFM